MSIGKAERETPPYSKILTASSAKSITQVPLTWTSFKPTWGLHHLSEFTQFSRPASRGISRVLSPSNLGAREASSGSSRAGRTSSPNAIRPKTGISVKSSRSPTLTCSKGTYIPGSSPPNPSRRIHSSNIYRLKFSKLPVLDQDSIILNKVSRQSSPDLGLDTVRTNRSDISMASGKSASPDRSIALSKFVNEVLNGEDTPKEIGQDLTFFKTWFEGHLVKTSKVKSLEASLEEILSKSYEATKDNRNDPDALRTAVAFSALDHIIPTSGRFKPAFVLIRRILCEAVYGIFPIGHTFNAFDSVPFFCERASFTKNEKELMLFNAQLKHDLELQRKQMARCIDRLDSAKADFFELKEKYIASGQQQDKLSENAHSLRIKSESLEMQNKEAAAQAHESRRALDEFKSGIDKASADLQSSLVITKSLLEEERRKNATLLQQNAEMKSAMIEKNDFAAFQIFTLLELQYKKKGLSFSKPPTDTHGYMNIALLNALEFLEGLQDK